ncbi:hypothetical protein N7495_009590 [Penicillium taxi]|uniref:uncharacterized protein n=1 Tax=Penicillium taxi TaxID=168475 RepID=UPI0025456389|nr:uncharacterized protein N7495_009590 [Penicillium taxi]KAJ5885080.1 hypothetical protein N7495_009590 [Penicillium taxi]
MAGPSNTNFTVFIRLPFPRGDFVDPPPVEWNAGKDQALWDILSRPSRGDDIDWKALADRFDVTLQFLLQQAAWLYDRQLSQVRAQMRKVGPMSHSNSPSPGPGSISGSTALATSAPKSSTVGFRQPTRPTPLQKEAAQRASTGHAQRTSSNSITTVNQLRGLRDPTRNDTPTSEAKDQRWENMDRQPSTTRRDQLPVASYLPSPILAEEVLTSSSEESDSEEETSPQGPKYHRFGAFSTHRIGLRDDEDDEDDTPAFLPMPRETDHSTRDRPTQGLSATLRLDAERAAARRRKAERSGIRNTAASESSTSSISSGAQVSAPRSEGQQTGNISGTLSPRHSSVSRLSPRKSGHETSDGTPSMGSSFSDLDDASVTQSALEEALMSNMQYGGMASRMSTISQALRSRYLQ